MKILNVSPRNFTVNPGIPDVSLVLTTLNDLAFQTNLFYLHALNESARAGKKAKGFSIASWELGVLACRCRDSARESEKLIFERGHASFQHTVIVGALHMVIYDIERAVSVIGNISGDSNGAYGVIQEIADGLTEAAVCAKSILTPSKNGAESDTMLRHAQVLQNVVRELALEPQ